MRDIPMKKLLLIPTVLVTGFLAISFLMPATAANVLRSVVPAAQISLRSVVTARSGNETATNPAGTVGSVGSPTSTRGSSSSAGSSSSGGSSSSLPGATGDLLASTQDSGHSVATPSQENCGRFGNGSHGGKHDFTCPNRPFPDPAS